MFDYLIVGAGFSGSVLAERLASAGNKVCLVDRRPHIAGNAYDRYDEHGVLVHAYGPHIFHTNSAKIYKYLSRFTAWRPYEHRVLASIVGQHVPFPINGNTIDALYGLDLDDAGVAAFYREQAESPRQVRTLEDAIVSKIGRKLYSAFIENYTRKQWGMEPAELDASIAARVPARTNRDNRYFTDTFQAMPRHGYTRMFERMLANPKIWLLLQASYDEVKNEVAHKHLIYTGPIDEYFGYCDGKLPYRSLRFEFTTHDSERVQPAAVINHPGSEPYTRVTEFKWLTGQIHPKTSLVYEYPSACGEPYYPIPKAENDQLYRQYKARADTLRNVSFLGRLGTYKYYNMDQCVGQALALFERLQGAVVGQTALQAAE